MEWYKILSLCLTSYSFRVLTNLLLHYLIVTKPSKKDKSNRASAAYADPRHRGCLNCKHRAEFIKAEPCNSCDVINGNPDKWETTP